MTAICVIAVIAALLAALLVFLRLRVCGTYGEGGAELTVSLLALPLLKLPSKEPEKTNTGKKPNKGNHQKRENTAPGDEPGFRELLSIITEVLGRLKRRLSIDELTLWYQSAGEDPAAAALGFGGASAAAGALLQPLQRVLRIRKLDVRTAVSFTETKPRVYACLRASVSLGAFLWLAGRVLFRLRRQRKESKTQDTEGASWKSTRSGN